MRFPEYKSRFGRVSMPSILAAAYVNKESKLQDDHQFLGHSAGVYWDKNVEN
jgi:hypothetical protein